MKIGDRVKITTKKISGDGRWHNPDDEGEYVGHLGYNLLLIVFDIDNADLPVGANTIIQQVHRGYIEKLNVQNGEVKK